jgi:insertion element IS1 protein InsB
MFVGAFNDDGLHCGGGETCHVERWFGTLRARLSRLARKTYSFSKCAENHLDAVHFFIVSYNLQIKQSILG